MGRCPITNVIEILDDYLTPTQTGSGDQEATTASARRCTGNIISLSLYKRHNPISKPEFEKCTDRWDRLFWSLPSGPVNDKMMQVTLHTLAIFKSSDVQLMARQLPLLSMLVNPPLEPNPKQHACAQGGRPDGLPNPKARQGQASTARPQLSPGKATPAATARQSPQRAYPPPGPSRSVSLCPRAATSDTTSQTSQTRDSAGNTNTSISSLSAEDDGGPPHACGVAPTGAGERSEAPGDDTEADRRDRYPLLNPRSEYQANLDAVSPECKDLFLGASGRSREEEEEAEAGEDEDGDGSAGAYWTWSRREQQWFHEDTDCGTVVWFPKDFD